MQRRTLLKAMGMCGLGLAGMNAFQFAHANPLKMNKTDFSILDNLNVLSYDPANGIDTIPRVIMIFLYGGPSELAGNLSNIEEINAASQNPYGQEFDPGATETVVTPNFLWSDAGGNIMEEMLAAKQMSIYRTVFREKENNRSHGPSVTQNLLGSLDMQNPGIASNVAKIMMMHEQLGQPLFAGKALNELLFPIVTFHGENQLHNLGNLSVNPNLRPISLSENLSNPFKRGRPGIYSDSDFLSYDERLDSLARQVSEPLSRLQKINTAFSRRKVQADNIDNVLHSTRINSSIARLNESLPEGEKIDYENYGGFGNRLKAAVSLMLGNDETVFASVGSSGLGGWDDHSDAFEEYPDRMVRLMGAQRAAMRHIEAVKAQGLPLFDGDGNYLENVAVPHAGNIIFHTFGDFGRIVNLNSPRTNNGGGGWDHGDNQNLYTFGGENVRGVDALGKIVGTTKRIGKEKTNGQFTAPTDDSYWFEPFSIASSIYGYFGVQNPEAFNGEKAIAESGAGAPPNEWVNPV